jgi:hypothetical protein
MPTTPRSSTRSRPGELRSLLGGRVVGHRKVDVEHSDEVRVGLDDLSDRVSSKRLLPEPGLDLVEDLGVVGIVVVKDLLVRMLYINFAMTHYPAAEEASQLTPTLSFQRLKTEQPLSDEELHAKIRKHAANQHAFQILEALLIFNKHKSEPTTKNMPNGFLGYSMSGRKDGSSRKERATLVGW